MNVASLEACKELYELSGWEDADELDWHYDNGGELWHRDEQHTGFLAPAYDLGYLLRKLPQNLWLDRERNGQLQMAHDYEGDNPEAWLLHYIYTSIHGRASTPEDAACKLAIELFKQGVLEKAA